MTMTLYTATVTLILVMDPIGNIPIFLSVLNPIEPARRTAIILRESIIALAILALFLFCGELILYGFGISEHAFRIGGGIVLFLIALRMIFPVVEVQKQRQVGEPFIVPLAVPLVAGPSAMATVVLLATESPEKMGTWFIALLIASSLVTLTLLFSNQLNRILGQKVLTALERLMGMLLTTLAVQMFLAGLSGYFGLEHKF